MVGLKKSLGVILALSLSVCMSTFVSAQDYMESTPDESQLTTHYESMDVRQSVNVTISGYSQKTFYVSTPYVYDVSMYFSQGSSRFAVQVDDSSGMVMQKVFDNSSMPVSYTDRSGYYGGSSVMVTIFNDSPYSSNFVGSITFPSH